MQKIILIIIMSVSCLYSDPFKPLDIDFLEKKSKLKNEKKRELKKKDKEKEDKSFESKIKDLEKISGLFTFYYNSEKNTAFLSIKPDQFDKTFLAGLTRQSGDARYYDGSSMQGEYPFFFKQIGEMVQMVEENVRFRSENDAPTQRALDNLLSNSIISSTKIEADPHPETGDILVDATKLFVRDVSNVGSRDKKFTYDKTNSYFESIKSFPNNTEIEITLHFTSNKPRYVFTLPSSRSMIHRYHISLSKISQSNYQPRIADDRVGHFLTMYQDYSDISNESAYVRYINRWNLKKSNPKKKLSIPEKPIVYWLENTIPKKYRKAIRDGILAWNIAFEAIGFKDALVVKQMPDDAEWDPADVRYSTIRWLIQPGSAYAVGPSRANPFTGELYDADIRVSADYVRYYYTDMDQYIEPLVSETFEEYLVQEDSQEFHSNDDHCMYAEYLKQNMAFTWFSNIDQGNLTDSDRDKMREDFIYNALVDLLLHEVGHTLGLRHNFKASSVYTLDEISDPEFTAKHGVTGSVMDYNATNLMDKGGTYFQTIPGPYDMWAIEYAYAEKPYNSQYSESVFLSKIASKSTNPLLAYGTDEDAFGSSTRSIDPYTSSRDLSGDPISFYQRQLDNVHIFWEHMLDRFETEGERYPRIRKIFSNGLYEYFGAARNTAKFIGGVQHSRHHVGDKNKNPFISIPATEQRRALEFLDNYILSPNVFNFPADLLNKLTPERYPDFHGSTWNMSRLDYPIHSRIKSIQSIVLFRIFSYRVLNRVQDNELRFPSGEDIFTMEELFTKATSMVWRELELKNDVNSFRRNLQSQHVMVLTTIMRNELNRFPHDAKSLARQNLNKIYTKLKFAMQNSDLDEYTFSHYQESANQIYSAYKAQTVLN